MNSKTITSTLFRIHTDKKILQGIKEIDFSDHNFLERYDIQEWVEATPDILGEKLLIIAKEKTYFDNTRERPDLIAIDKLGNIVIIELKRDDSGIGLEWQAIKYASYWSRFKKEQILDVFSDHLSKDQISDEEIAEQKISEFIEEDSLDNLNKNQRIILVSHRYAKEVTSAVNWLIDKYSTDIKCVQLIPYYDSDKDAYYLQSNTILPLPGVDHLLVGAYEKGKEASYTGGAYRKEDEVTAFFEEVRDKVLHQLPISLKPIKHSRWAGIGQQSRYYHFWYKETPWDNWGFSYKIWMFDEDHTDDDLRGKFGIYLDFHEDHLLNNGVTENAIKKLKSYFKKFNKMGAEYNNEKGNNWLEIFAEKDGLSDKKGDELTNVVCDLIKETKEKVSHMIA